MAFNNTGIKVMHDEVCESIQYVNSKYKVARKKLYFLASGCIKNRENHSKECSIFFC